MPKPPPTFSFSHSLIFFFTFIPIVSGLLSVSCSAQEMWGIANSNYAGNMGLALNPASIVGAPYKYEINLIAGDFFVDQNYVYSKGTAKPYPYFLTKKTLYNYTTTSTKHGYGSMYLIGPSYILNKGDRAWAIQTHLRAIASGNDFSYNLANTIYSVPYLPQQGIAYSNATMKGAALLFGDISFSYGRTLISNEKDWLAWGVTGRVIIAFDGMYVNANIGNYVVPDSTTWNIKNMNLEYAHSSANFGDKATLGNMLSFRGLGAGADGGLIYIHKRMPSGYKCDRDADMIKRYNYRLGVSLMDVGYVHFFNAAQHRTLQDASAVWPDTRVRSIYDFDQALSNRFLGNPNSTLVSNKFAMMTPMAISAQFDYCYKPRWYGNLSVVQRIPVTYKEVARANQLALVPRYETRQFEASVSANLYEYEHVSMGVAVRWWIFALGSDRLLSYFISPVRSFDLFFGLRYNSCTMNSKKTQSGQCPFD